MSAAFESRRRLVWLFDLDNTLHDTSAEIFPQINRLMNAYIMRKLGLGEAEASRLRVELWQRYGATLLGLVERHGVDAHEFLREAHAFEDLESMIRAERGLIHALKRLPGRKVLLTNAPTHYARQVLYHLGLDTHFHGRYAVEQMRVRGRFRPKPSRTMLAHVIARERVSARQCVFVEDTVVNLKRAKALGLRTVLVTGMTWRRQIYAKLPTGVDLKVKSVTSLPRALAHLR